MPAHCIKLCGVVISLKFFLFFLLFPNILMIKLKYFQIPTAVSPAGGGRRLCDSVPALVITEWQYYQIFTLVKTVLIVSIIDHFLIHHEYLSILHTTHLGTEREKSYKNPFLYIFVIFPLNTNTMNEEKSQYIRIYFSLHLHDKESYNWTLMKKIRLLCTWYWYI